MMELTINGNVYNINFGIAFMRELNKKVTIPVEGIPGKSEQIGLRYEIANFFDGDIESLITLIDIGNKGQDPRLTKAAIEAYIEDPDTDIDELFKQVKDFLLSANVTKKEALRIQKELDRRAAQEAQENQEA